MSRRASSSRPREQEFFDPQSREFFACSRRTAERKPGRWLARTVIFRDLVEEGSYITAP